jgi:hypothetical protein
MSEKSKNVSGASRERTFVIAVRRDRRSEMPADWVETVRNIEGVSIRDISSSSRRLTVIASTSAVQQIREMFSGLVLVEEAIPHVTAGDSH